MSFESTAEGRVRIDGADRRRKTVPHVGTADRESPSSELGLSLGLLLWSGWLIIARGSTEHSCRPSLTSVGPTIIDDGQIEQNILYTDIRQHYNDLIQLLDEQAVYVRSCIFLFCFVILFFPSYSLLAIPGQFHEVITFLATFK